MIYQPREDSYLLAQVVREHAPQKRVLDMGTGSGILALAAQEAGAKSVRAADCNPDAVKMAAEKGIPSQASDLFDSIVGMFDLIIFNPPYLPDSPDEDAASKLATTGGKDGDETVLKFLDQAPPHLAEGGSILLLLSSLTPRKRIDIKLSELSLRKKKLAGKKEFMEELEVWQITRK